MVLEPIDIGDASGLREGVQALAPTVALLALLPVLEAGKVGGVAGGAWRLQFLPKRMGVPVALELCAAFDRPGLPSRLEGQVGLILSPPAGAGPGPLGAYLAQCEELAGRLMRAGPDFVGLALVVDDTAEGEDEGAGEAAGGAGEGDGGGGDFLGRVLGAMLPGAALHMRQLKLLLKSGAFPPGCISRHLAVPGLAFPLLEALDLDSKSGEASMAVADVVTMAGLAAPLLHYIGLLYPPEGSGPCGSILGGAGTCCAGLAVTALALTRPRPVDAAGRPAALKILVGCVPGASSEQDVADVLAAAGREWVTVQWPLTGPADGGTDA